MDFAKDLRKLLVEQKQTDVLDEQIEQLLTQVNTGDLATASEADLAKMRDELLAIQRTINPYGRTIAGKNRLLCGSLTIVRDEYQMRFLLTTIIGFLFRALNEWNVPENVPPVDVYEYMKNPEVLKPPQMANGKPPSDEIMNAYAESRAWMEKRMVVLQFLEDTLLFNPDEHVRSAYTPNPDDPERKPVGTPAAQLAVYHRRRELQAKKKKDLRALYRADTMVDYVDKILFAVPDEEYRTKLLELKERVLKDLQKFREEIATLSTRTTITERKTIVGRDGTTKDIEHTRELTPEDEAAGLKRLKELYVIVGQLVGNLGDIDLRMQRFDDYLAWKERQATNEAQEAEERRKEEEEIKKLEEVTKDMDLQAKIAYAEQLNAAAEAKQKAQEASSVQIGKVEVPTEPGPVLAEVDRVIAANRQVEEATVDIDIAAVDKTASDPVEEHNTQVLAKEALKQQQDILEEKKKKLRDKKKKKNIVQPKLHILPPTADEVVADATAVAADLHKDIGSADRKVRERVTTKIPPHDIFNKLQRYMDQNFEHLRDVVRDLYPFKLDLDTMFNPYEMFEDDPPGTSGARTKEDKADDFVYRHRDATIAPIITFSTNKWNLMGSFSANRDRIRFYNSNTSVLEEMANQIQRDQMLGRDLMAKKKEKKRRANREAGRDETDEGDKKFQEWRKANPGLAGTLEDQNDDDPERPDDAIDVPVITIKEGGLIVEKTKFYTQAEAPVHVKDVPEAFQTRKSS